MFTKALSSSCVSLSLALLSSASLVACSGSSDDDQTPAALPALDSSANQGQGNVVSSGTPGNGQGETSSPNTSPVEESKDSGSDTDEPSDHPSDHPSLPSFTPSTVTTVEINASDYEKWLHFDLDLGKSVESDDPSWDLAFKRTTIKMNDGVKGLNLKEAVFESVTAAPEGVFAPDAHPEGKPEAEGRFFHTPEAWYSYDMSTHLIATRNWTYLVQTNGGHVVKLTFTDYYNFDRESGFPQLKSQLISRY